MLLETRTDEPTAIRTQIAAIFVSLELSRSNWLITSLSPGNGDKMSRHGVDAGDMAALQRLFAELQRKALVRTGKSYPIITIHEAGLDGFWIHRALQKEGIESHVVDAASIAAPRRRRRAKTDRIDGEALLRVLLAYKRGEPRVCSMVVAPTPEEEDRRRLCRERQVLIDERISHVNRIKGLLFAQGICGYAPLRRNRRSQLEALRTGDDGRALPEHVKAQISRELDRLELLLAQIKAVEAERNALLAAMVKADGEQAQASHPLVLPLGVKGIGVEFASALWLEASTGPSPIAGSSPPMRALRRRPGRVVPSRMSRAYPRPAIRGCGPSWSSSPGYGYATSRNRRWRAGSTSKARASARTGARAPSSHWRASFSSPCGSTSAPAC